MTIPLLQNSHGTQPQVILDEIYPEGIVAIDFADEAGVLLVATRSGQISLVRADGQFAAVDRNFQGISRVVFCATGQWGAAIRNDNRFVCFDARLQQIWDAQITGRIRAIAIAPYGSHLAFTTDSGSLHLVNIDRRELAKISTMRPLHHLAFLREETTLIGAAEFGQLGAYDLKGRELWNERVMNNVGDMCVTGCGRRILLAAFNHGVQVCNGSGRQLGAFMVDGIPSRVAASSTRTRIAALTLEHRVYWMNFEGQIQWAADLTPDPPEHLAVSPLGDRLFLATQSGRLLQLQWN